jgi:chorismate-pyruvate lyase
MADIQKTFPGLLHPLSLMRRARGLASLPHQEIDPSEFPEPYRQLLAHEGDMTSRLENYYHATIEVKILRSSNDGKNYFREVLLQTNEPTPRSVEYGAIEIQLGVLPDLAKEAVLAGDKPLGGILNMGRIPYSCALRGFFKISPDESILELFGVQDGTALFGRSNRIETRAGETIAQIVEILPPA